MRLAVVALSVVALLAVSACASDAPSDCPEGTDEFVEYQLFMGRSNASGEVVDDAAWHSFLLESVIPRFPDGLTVLDGRGHWRGSEGLAYEERSKLLVILAPPRDPAMQLTDEISAEYEKKFMQESVLRVVSDACVSFS